MKNSYSTLVLTALITGIVLMPVVVLVLIAMDGSPLLWSGLLSQSRIQALTNTLLLCTGVGLLVTCLGTSLAWLVTAYEFQGRKVLAVALLLPMAIPTYIMAYACLDLVHPLGPVQGLFREILGIKNPKDFSLPDIRSLTGAIFLLGFVLFPYVYISARTMFMTLPANLVESAKSLGVSTWQIFWRIALPQARPGILAGLGIALLETINDVGASEFLGVRTITVELYTTWITKSDLASAAKIATLLLAGILLISLIEKFTRQQRRYSQTKSSRTLRPTQLVGSKAWLASLLGWTPVFLGFAMPAGHLLYQVLLRARHQDIWTAELKEAAAQSLFIALVVSLLTLVIGVIVSASTRRWTSTSSSFNPLLLFSNISKTGYFLPGTILAIGLLMPFSVIDHFYKISMESIGLHPEQLLMLGTSAGIITACSIRFLGISISNLEAGFSRISIRLDQASRSLGRTAYGTLIHIDLPLLKPAMMTATLLVFVECMKELPTTLLLRPMSTETLATLLYADAARGNYEDGAMAALSIVIIGILPLVYLTRIQQKSVKRI